MMNVIERVREAVGGPAEEAAILQRIESPRQSVAHWVRVAVPRLLNLMALALFTRQYLGFGVLFLLVVYSLVAVEREARGAAPQPQPVRDAPRGTPAATPLAVAVAPSAGGINRQADGVSTSIPVREAES